MSGEMRTARRERVLPWALIAVALAVLGAALSIWRPTAPSVGEVATDLDTFDPAVLAAVEAYWRPRFVAVWAATALGVAVPVLLALTRPGRRVVARVAGDPDHAPLRAGLVAVTIAAATSVVVLPVAAWSRLVHDGRFGFRTQSAAAWLGDWLLVSATHWLGWGLAAGLLVVAVRRWPRSWPYRATVGATASVALIVLVHPVVFQPVLLPTAALPDVPARDVVEEVAAAAGATDVPIVVGEASRRTTRINAMVVGLGPTRRIVLHDNLLELSPERIAAVVAHEIAHHQHRDLERVVALSATGLLPALVLLQRVLSGDAARRRTRARGPTDPRLIAVAMAFAAVVELVAQPVANHVSRQLEAAADSRAVEITEDAANVVRVKRVFPVRDLSPPEAPAAYRFMFATHPSVRQRIRQAVALAGDGSELPDLATLRAEERVLLHERVARLP